MIQSIFFNKGDFVYWNTWKSKDLVIVLKEWDENSYEILTLDCLMFVALNSELETLK
jgi:hypothetical protein